MILAIILALCIANIIGCATLPCPKQDIVMPMVNPITGSKINVVIEKGDCDNPDNYMTKEEFERQLRERRMR